jgi:LPS-assembly lipoprotein
LAAAAGVSGCGFHPVYGPLSGGGTVRPELAAIYVAVFPERVGQLLRQALQQRIEGAGEGVAKMYELSGGFGISAEAIGIQRDSSSDRVRLDARASWQLRKLDPKQTLMTNGSAHVIDGFDINDQQYFAADLEQSSAFQRLAETVADQITLDLALYFRKQAGAA